MPALVVIDPKAWHQLAGELKAYDKKLYAAMRKRIREAGNIAVEKVRDELAKSPPSGGGSSIGGRAALAAGTKASLSFAARAAGVKITTSSRNLPAEHKGLLGSYNKKSWRHPVHGGDAWVSQEGRPYFGKVIGRALNKEILDEIQAAIDDSFAAMKGVG
jgi:hypothetical protein